jgi:hypothetical protein
MSVLESDSYDPSSAVESLIRGIRYHLGGPGYRMVGPEIESFIRVEVADALRGAFREAESAYLRQMCEQSDRATATLLQGVLAGTKLGRQAKERD